jgi:hypothetical protein
MPSSRTRQLFKLLATLPPRVVYTEPIQSPMLSIPNASTCAEASTMVPSDDELLIVHIYAYRSKRAALVSEVA